MEQDFDHLLGLLLNQLRKCDDPKSELDEFINDVHGMLRDLEKIQHSFDELCDATRKEPENVSDEVFRGWEENPTYLLVDQNETQKHFRDLLSAINKLQGHRSL